MISGTISSKVNRREALFHIFRFKVFSTVVRSLGSLDPSGRAPDENAPGRVILFRGAI